MWERTACGWSLRPPGSSCPFPSGLRGYRTTAALTDRSGNYPGPRGEDQFWWSPARPLAPPPAFVRGRRILVAYRVIGSDVEADGRLHEPFALIPLAWLSGLAGAVLVAVNFWRVRAKR